MRTRAIAVAAAVLLAGLIGVPTGSSESPYTDSNTSEDCWAVALRIARGPIPCSVTLDATLTGHGCQDGLCTYTVNFTGTGRSTLPGWLTIQTELYTALGAYVCVGSYPAYNFTRDFVPCESRACGYATLGTEVACPASLTIEHSIPRGKCSMAMMTARLFRDYNAEYAVTGVDVIICHLEDGSMNFRSP